MKRIAIAAVVVAMGVGASAAGAAPIPSEVKITDAFPDMGGLHFEGKVKSPRSRCEGPGRNVDLYRAGPGSDQFVEFGLTNDSGRWVINAPTVAGRYYVKIEKLLSLGGERPCARDRSRKVEFN